MMQLKSGKSSIPVTLGSKNLLIFQGVRRPQWSGQIETSNQTNRRLGIPPNDGDSGLSAAPRSLTVRP